MKNALKYIACFLNDRISLLVWLFIIFNFWSFTCIESTEFEISEVIEPIIFFLFCYCCSDVLLLPSSVIFFLLWQSVYFQIQPVLFVIALVFSCPCRSSLSTRIFLTPALSVRLFVCQFFVFSLRCLLLPFWFQKSSLSFPIQLCCNSMTIQFFASVSRFE